MTGHTRVAHRCLIKRQTTNTLMKLCIPLLATTLCIRHASAKLADRGRLVNARNERSDAAINMNSRVGRAINAELPIEGPRYRGERHFEEAREERRRTKALEDTLEKERKNKAATWQLDPVDGNVNDDDETHRILSSQLTGCCSNYKGYTAMSLCSFYGEDCTTGAMPSHDSGDGDCEQEGLSFIGISFSVNTAHGSPYSYQLCDQYPMENIIDRNYDYVMSMDEDGWLVGGGYKSFDYSGKMPYIDSSHTELLRIGSIDPEYGGTSIEQVYDAMYSLSFPPFSVFPEYVKGGGKHHSGDDDDDAVPSGDVTLIVSIVEEYSSGNAYSDYEIFLSDLFNAMDSVGGGPCMDDHDTDPHVSMSRGVKFKSSYHEQQYFWKVNLEVAVWQAAYPKGVVIGSAGSASFPPEKAMKNRKKVGYGNLYFFFDRANITTAFPPNRDITESEEYYSTLYFDGGMDTYYQSVTSFSFDYSGSGSGNKNQYYEHNAYAWNAKMAKHDMTDGWDLPPNCNQEGEGFLGIPLSRKSDSNLQVSSTFQSQFDFEYLLDRNFTYMQKFGTNHGWLVGEQIGNGAGSIVDKDTAHIPLFYYGTTNEDMGGLSLSSIVKISKSLEFGKLYIKPAFLFQDDDSSIKLQFEADATSSLGYLYDALCKQLGIAWNYDKPYNSLGIYTNCAMHAAGDRAKYGCGPENSRNGGFCPQMTLAYRVGFQSEDHASAYFYKGNQYVDYWRSLYPNGIAVGTDTFCPDGGCLGLFLNRYDLYQVFKPDLGGSWVEYNGGTAAPTISPAPTFDGGCDNPHNSHLDMCFRRHHQRKASAVAWESLGAVGQLSILLVAFMATTLSVSIFLSRARKRKRHGESYLGFFMRDLKRKKKRKRLKKKDRKGLEEDMLPEGFEDDRHNPPPPPRPGTSRSIARSKRSSRSRSRTRSKSRGRSSSRAGSRAPRSGSVRAKDKTHSSGDESRKKHSSGDESRKKSGRSRSRSRSHATGGRSSSKSRKPEADSTTDNKSRSRNVTSKRRQLV